MKRKPNKQVAPLSYNATLVLRAMTQGYEFGFDIMRVTELPSGTVYPLLRRLEAGGLVDSGWEDDESAHDEGRPARRYYAITKAGERQLEAALKRIASQQRLLGDLSAPA